MILKYTYIDAKTCLQAFQIGSFQSLSLFNGIQGQTKLTKVYTLALFALKGQMEIARILCSLVRSHIRVKYLHNNPD